MPSIVGALYGGQIFLSAAIFASNVVGSAMATVSAALFTSRKSVPCRMRRMLSSSTT